jgi:Xaa-Pro aminopeptidase
MNEALEARADRLDEHLRRRGLRAAWFVTDSGVAWLFGRPPGRDDAGRRVVAAGYVRGEGDGGESGFRAVVDAAEADRLNEEVIPDGVAVERVEWYESSPLDAVSKSTPRPAAADVSVPGFESLDGAHLRLPLFDSDRPTFRRLGREVAAAVERVCRELRPGDTEREVAAGVRIGLATDDVDVVSLRVAGSERPAAYPRPTPTDRQLGDHATVALTAARDGRHVSLARSVVFESTPFDAAHEAARTVAAAGVEAASEATDSGGLFAGIRDGYAAAGHPEGWRHSPPGGAVGYAPREWVARPDGDASVDRPFGLAMTPWVDGAAYGDTFLTPLEGDPERITTSGAWPTEERDGVHLVEPLRR